MLQASVRAKAGPEEQLLLQRRCGLGQPELLNLHAAFGEGSGLVAADHAHRAQGLHRREPSHQRLAPGHALHVDGQGQGDRGQQSLRHIGHDDPSRKHQAFRAAHPHKQQAEQKRQAAHRQGDGGDRVNDAAHLLLQGAGAAFGLG